MIIGGGQAGGRAALAARSADPSSDITLIAKESYAPYERPILSKGMLLEEGVKLPYVLDDATAVEQGIQLRLEETVTHIDRPTKMVILESGGKVAYDNLILATGSKLRRISLEGADESAVHYLRSMGDCIKLREQLTPGKRLAVIGGGFIGLEVAATAQKLGCDVTIVEAGKTLLPRIGSPAVSAFVQKYHTDSGVRFLFGVQAGAFKDGGLHLSDGTVLPTDMVLVGIGVDPETALAEAASLNVENGIKTDSFGRTSDPDIFAIGDAVNQMNPAYGRHMRLESWENANVQGDAAGRSAAGQLTEVSTIPWFWSDQGDLNIQILGMLDADRPVVERVSEEGGVTLIQLTANKITGAVTIDQARDMPLLRRMIADPQFHGDEAMFADSDVPLRKIMKSARR
ncbi:ferredoxin reductase [Phaeobacter inhibens]|nr:ferredoxin reductase [Phaeobacter inhibens]